MVACSVAVLVFPELGLLLAAGALGALLVIYGIRTIIYYVSMARHMVGGRALLFVGIIAIDIGAFILTLLDQPRIAIILYLVVTNGFTGLVSILQSAERRRLNTRWVPSLLHGIVNLLLAVACIVFIQSDDIIALVFCAGLLYSAATHIVSAFRKTDVAFIQ